MGLLNFKPKQTDAELHPARATLAAHVGAIALVDEKRRALAERDRNARQDCEAAEVAAGKVTTLRAACDLAEADKRYGGGAAPDLPDLEHQLLAAEKDSQRLAAVGRAAAIAHARYQGDMVELTKRQQELAARTPRLLFEALTEKQAARVGAYRAAVREFVAAGCALLEPGFEIDALAAENRWEPTGGSRQFYALFDTPHFPVLVTEPQDASIESAMVRGRALVALQEQQTELLRQCKARGEQLAQRLLAGTADD